MTGLEEAIAEAGLTAQVVWDGPIVTVLFAEHPIVDYRSAQAVDQGATRRWNEELLARGLLVNPVQQKWYLSTAHDEADVRATMEIAREAFAAASDEQ